MSHSQILRLFGSLVHPLYQYIFSLGQSITHTAAQAPSYFPKPYEELEFPLYNKPNSNSEINYLTWKVRAAEFFEHPDLCGLIQECSAKIDLHLTFMSNEDFIRLGSLLSNDLPHLVRLHLARRGYPSESGEEVDENILAPLLSAIPTLRHLELINVCTLTDKCVVAFVQALARNKSLYSANIGFCSATTGENIICLLEHAESNLLEFCSSYINFYGGAVVVVNVVNKLLSEYFPFSLSKLFQS